MGISIKPPINQILITCRFPNLRAWLHSIQSIRPSIHLEQRAKCNYLGKLSGGKLNIKFGRVPQIQSIEERVPSLLFQNHHQHESGDRGPDALFSCAGGGDKASVKRGTCSAFIIKGLYCCCCCCCDWAVQ